MKKLISLALCLMLLCGAAFAESTPEIDVTGVWYGDPYGIISTLTILEDGTYQIMSDNLRPYEGEWTTLDGMLVLDPETSSELTMRVTEAELSVSLDGLDFVFTREQKTAFVPAAVRTDVTAADFNGAWTMTHLTTLGLTFTPDMMNLGVSLTITEDGAQAQLAPLLTDELFETELSNIGYYVDASMTSYTADMSAVFENGALTLTEILPVTEVPAEPTDSDYEEDPFAPVPIVWTLHLLEDGSLRVTEYAELEETDVVFYMVPAETEIIE